jgi:hypothetical protein
MSGWRDRPEKDRKETRLVSHDGAHEDLLSAVLRNEAGGK